MISCIKIAGVSERDIDLLLLEEFQSSVPFQDWFVSLALERKPDLGRCIEAHRSVTQSTGESDLEVVFADGAGVKTRLLIENKVNAGLQPQQAERYRLRGENYRASGACANYHTIIVAPERYFGNGANTKGFDSRITYESILEWFLQAEALGARREYKVALLRSALDKGTLGYQPEEDAPTTDFWRAYWSYARDHAPELEMRPPSSKPSGSAFIYFRPPSLPRQIGICHKFRRGQVDLQLGGMGRRLNEVHAVLGRHLDPDMSLAGAAKSAAIRLSVPVLSIEAPFADQLEKVRIGLDAANRLLRWFMAHGEECCAFVAGAERRRRRADRARSRHERDVPEGKGEDR
jgi:hypothetical protein